MGNASGGRSGMGCECDVDGERNMKGKKYCDKSLL